MSYTLGFSPETVRMQQKQIVSQTHKKECPLDAQMSHDELNHLACITHGSTSIFESKHTPSTISTTHLAKRQTFDFV